MAHVSAQPCGCDPGARWVCEQHRDAEPDTRTILAALEKEIQLYLRTGMRVSPGRLALWLHEIRLAHEQAKEHDDLLALLKSIRADASAYQWHAAAEAAIAKAEGAQS